MQSSVCLRGLLQRKPASLRLFGSLCAPDVGCCDGVFGARGATWTTEDSTHAWLSFLKTPERAASGSRYLRGPSALPAGLYSRLPLVFQDFCCRIVRCVFYTLYIYTHKKHFRPLQETSELIGDVMVTYCIRITLPFTFFYTILKRFKSSINALEIVFITRRSLKIKSWENYWITAQRVVSKNRCKCNFLTVQCWISKASNRQYGEGGGAGN